ncbi:MAG: tRNA (adenosine(37)-N6)-threonylcarbamoyltransferase complex ATPase subunit type 1 TsaE [Candidatus Aminicenantes bacterium]|nr:tRNA (adenosine(37)-N6)-threonylcarbamoyltransferase complex ATPase subunit type 1 TsaE [Candidatus Aminicenantes bacterium]
MKRKKEAAAHRISTAISRSERETLALARDLAKGFRGREVVLLIGELGAGKTVFAKGIAAGLGLRDLRQVCSPSFTILNIYEARFPIFHLDLYRLEREGDILDLGWEDYLDTGVVVVEWGEKVPFDLRAIRVFIAMGKGDERRITIEMPVNTS